MIENVTIYTLEDPTTGEIRYVGKTKLKLSKRLQGHLGLAKRQGKKHYVSCWIKNLLNAGVSPIIKELDIVPDSEWEFWEVYWISQFKTWAFNLVNSDLGGSGGHKISEERKLELKRIWKGKSFRKSVTFTMLEETKKKLSIVKKGKSTWSAATKSKMSLYKKANPADHWRPAVAMNDFVVFNTTSEAAAYLKSVVNTLSNEKTLRQSITEVCVGKNKSLYGYSFKYLR
jgi:group I intron endonuclease